MENIPVTPPPGGQQFQNMPSVGTSFPPSPQPPVQPSQFPAQRSHVAGKIMVVAFCLLLIGGGAYAAYFFDVFNIRDDSASKEQMFTDGMNKLLSMESANYDAVLETFMEPRDPA